MNNAFIICFSILLVVLFTCMVIVKKSHTDYSYAIILLQIAITVTLIFYAFSVITTRMYVALLMEGLYCASSYWLLVITLNYIVFSTNYTDGVRFSKNLILITGVIDTLLMLLNILGEFMFSVDIMEDAAGNMFCWTPQFTPLFYIHALVCCALELFILLILFSKIICSPKIYRIKYFAVFVVMLCIEAMRFVNGIFDLMIDYSLFLYVVLAVVITYFIIYSVPSKLSRKVLFSVSENNSSSIICFDHNDKCVYVNDLACKLLKAKKDEFEIFESEFYIHVKQNRENNISKDRFERKYTIDGCVHTFSVRYREMRDDNGTYLGCFFLMDDRTEEIEDLKREKYRATHDKLTGLLTRTAFIEEAEKILSENQNEKFYLIATNIREFKLINTLFGNKTGDLILRKQAEELTKMCVDKRMTAGRIMGDKFAMLIPVDMYDKSAAMQSMSEVEQITKAYNYKLRMAIGIYLVEDHNDRVQNMYDKACLAVESIKSDYFKTFGYYDSSLMKKALHEKNVINEFDIALKNEQFKMYLQAQVDSKGEVIGAEALVRWQHPTQGLIFPGEFIGILEKTGHIHKLDVYIWEQAAKKLYEWKHRGFENKHISVNISVNDFYYVDIYKIFTGLVRKYDISPENLKLEITETVFMQDREFHLEMLRKLRKFGFKIEVDDFGSGYSSLNMLKDIKADVLKIDMGFLRETENHIRSRVILNSIINMSRKLGMQVVSEGVEKQEQIEVLKEMGCDFFQGYFFSKPIKVEDFEKRYM